MIPGSISLDTSVVMRLLTGEPLALYQEARQFLHGQLAGRGVVYVSDLVLYEAYFALQHGYDLRKDEALAALALFAQTSGVTVTPVARAVLAVTHLATTKPGFADRLIHGTSHASGHTLVTFEKAGKKLPATFILPS